MDITMTILSAGDIDNTAEITSSTAVDANGEPLTEPDGTPIADIDSIADGIDTDILSDGIIDNTGGDEDDHDIASISVTTPPPSPLTFTGRDSVQMFILALLAIGIGMGMVLLGNAAFATRKED